MGDFSRVPAKLLDTSRRRGYRGVHIEQGVPLLDRDLNLLHDLLAETVRATFANYIGDGLPAGADGFAIGALDAPHNSQDFSIAAGPDDQPGTCLVAGMEVSIPKATTYAAQNLPGGELTTPTAEQPDPRRDLVYLDVSVTEIDAATDHDLANSDDVGMQTSVRLKLDWKVRVAQGVADGQPVPAPADANHHHYPIAELRRPHGVDTIDESMITDLRQHRLTVSDLEKRLSLVESLLLQPVFAAPPQPQIVPRRGGPGLAVTLSGNNFGNGSMTVLFGGRPADVLDILAADKVQVSVPAGLTPDGADTDVHITVGNQIGSSTSTETFRVLATPAFGARGAQFGPSPIAPGDRLTINGFNLTAAGLRVAFGTNPEIMADANLGLTPTSIVIEVPAGTVPDAEVANTMPILLHIGDRTVTSDDLLRVERRNVAPAFDDQQFFPASANVGQPVHLSGLNLNFSPKVTFVYPHGAVDSAALTNITATTITATVPAPPAPADPQSAASITVTTKGGSVTSGRQLIVRTV
jgi:hypothetical protein